MDLQEESMLDYANQLLEDSKTEKVSIINPILGLSCDYCGRVELDSKIVCNHCVTESLGYKQPVIDPNKELVEKMVIYRDKVANTYSRAIRHDLNENLNHIFERVAYNDFCELYKDRQQSVMDLMRWIHQESLDNDPIVSMENLTNINRWIGSIWEDLVYLKDRNCFRHCPEFMPLLHVMISFHESISLIISE